MPKIVQLSSYGDVDQLRIIDVAKPEPAAGEIVVRTIATGTNPGEISIREGLLKDMFPMDFPFGQGTDFAGRVDGVGVGVTDVAAGDEVVGWTDRRAAQAEYVATTAVAAVRAVALKPGDVVAVSAAAGGVGSLAVQIARRAGARVLGIASEENAPFLRSIGIEPVAYGDGLADRLRELAPNGPNAFVDLFGGGYVELALSLGVARERIDTIIDFAGAQKHGVKAEGSAEAASRETLATIANLIGWGEIVMPLTAIYPFTSLRDAYVELARRKTRGKIVLTLDPAIAKPIRPLLPTA
jgi:NADPH2:quinone reductase